MHEPSQVSRPSGYPHFLYFPSGAPATALGDIDVFFDGERYHLFHLVQQSHHCIAHAVSDNGFTWETLEPALGLGKRGRFDDDMLWTMRVMRHPQTGYYHMYYTGCSSREDGRIQRVGLAVSQDLLHWQRWSEDPILEAADPHYLTDLNRVGVVSFRDPFVFVDSDGLWHMLVTARQADGPRFRSACVAHATSQNGLDWMLESPLYTSCDFEDMEVPIAFQAGDFWYLMFNTLGATCTKVRFARQLSGPWTRPPGPELLPPGNSIAGVCVVGSRRELFHIIASEADWPRRDLFKHPFKWVVSPPKLVDVQPDGSLRLTSSERWNDFVVGNRNWAESFSPEGTDWQRNKDGQLSCQDGRNPVLRGSVEVRDFRLRGTLAVENVSSCKIHFRCDAHWDDGYAVELDFANGLLRFLKFRHFDCDLRRYKLASPRTIQETSWDLAQSQPLTFQLIAAGDYLEFSVNGSIALSTSSYYRDSGFFVLSIDQGNAVFQDGCLEELKIPYRD